MDVEEGNGGRKISLVDIKSANRDKIDSVLNALLLERDRLETIVVSYTVKDEMNIYSLWFGDFTTKLIGQLKATEHDLLRSMME